MAEWRRARRRGERCRLAIEHLMASTAIPVRLSGGTRRRRLLHGRIGAADRAAVSAAASRRKAHHRARRRPVHRASAGRRDSRHETRSLPFDRPDRGTCAVVGIPRQPRRRPRAPVPGQSPSAPATGERQRGKRARRVEYRRLRALSVARPRRLRIALRRPPAARRPLPAARTRQHARYGRQSAVVPAVRSRIRARADDARPRRRDGTTRRARRLSRRRDAGLRAVPRCTARILPECVACD